MVKIVRNFKKGLRESQYRRQFLVPENGEEAERIHGSAFVMKMEHWDCEFVNGDSRNKGKVPVIRFRFDADADAILGHYEGCGAPVREEKRYDPVAKVELSGDHSRDLWA